MINKKICILGISFLYLMILVSIGWTQSRLNIKTVSEQKAKISVVKETQSITKPPRIISHFAVEKGPYGYIWKIYIEAEDPDGDMYRIACVVEETGFGSYPPDWIILKPQYRKYFKGYLQWNTISVSGSLPEWTQIILKISIFDKAGNESNEVVFPFTFEQGLKSPCQYSLPPPFDKGELPRIGHINTNLFPPGSIK